MRNIVLYSVLFIQNLLDQQFLAILRHHGYAEQDGYDIQHLDLICYKIHNHIRGPDQNQSPTGTTE